MYANASGNRLVNLKRIGAYEVPKPVRIYYNPFPWTRLHACSSCLVIRTARSFAISSDNSQVNELVRIICARKIQSSISNWVSQNKFSFHCNCSLSCCDLLRSCTMVDWRDNPKEYPEMHGTNMIAFDDFMICMKELKYQLDSAYCWSSCPAGRRARRPAGKEESYLYYWYYAYHCWNYSDY